MIAQFTAKMTNSEKAISFLSLTSCSINKLKSHMFFTFKKFMFSDFKWKKPFAAGNGRGAAHPLTPFLYGPATTFSMWVINTFLQSTMRA